MKLLCIFLLTLSIFGMATAQSGGERDTIIDSLTAAQPTMNTTFAGKAGDIVILTARSQDFDAYLTLTGPEGTVLAEDDDSAGLLDPRIGPLSLPANGTYTVTVSSYGGGLVTSTGAFTLIIDRPDPALLAYGETVQSSAAAGAALYTLRGTAGQALVVTLLSDGYYSPTLELRAATAANDVLAEGYYFYGGSSAGMRIGPFVFPETGNYLLMIVPSSGEETAFTLRAEQVTVQTLNYGDVLDVTLSADDERAYFSFEGAAGDAVNIVVNSSNTIDTALTLANVGGSEITRDDDGGAGFDPEINRQLLNEDGVYFIILQKPAGTSGTVQLKLEKAALISLDDGPAQVSLNDDRSREILVFTGKKGESVRLDVRVLGVNRPLINPYISVTQAGNTVAYSSGTLISRLSFEFTVPEDGMVSILLENYTFERITLEATLTRVSDV